MEYTNLQQVIYPSDGINIMPDDALYFRKHNQNVIQDNINKKLVLLRGGDFTTDTFFNSLSVETWKQHTSVNNLFFRLKAKGRFTLKFMLHHLNHNHSLLMEKVVQVNEELLIPLTFWSKIDSGMLYFSLVSLKESEFYDASYSTTDFPKNDVKLGIVVTHFNRKEYVVPAIKRIQNDLINDETYVNKLELIVIDNSQNIKKNESYNATVIPNLNLGGAGGFTRGLLYLKENDFTHCLFMDDDASCEIESIRRCFALQQFNKTEKFALAGALLGELESYRMFEKGARFTGVCEPLKSNLDMRQINDLLISEEEEKIDYGGWWFFSFAINDVTSFAFPFFVRGDDSLFSLMNDFNICTMNGIACWGDDFAFKHGVLQNYLDTRYHLMHGIQYMELTKKSILKRNFLYFMNQLIGYNYSSAKAINMAFEHIMEGPDFWKENMNMSKIFPLIGNLAKIEKLEKINIRTMELYYASPKEPFLRKLIRKLTLNGNLIPSLLYKDKTLFHEKGFGSDSKAIFRYKKVLYYYSPKKMGYIAEYDQKTFFSELMKHIKLSIKFYKNFETIKKQYKKELPEFTSESFWKKIYSDIGESKQ